jgi:hypothetical protein
LISVKVQNISSRKPNICWKKKKKSVQTGRHHQFCFQIKLQQMIREHLLE